MWSDALKEREVAAMHDAAKPTVDREEEGRKCVQCSRWDGRTSREHHRIR